MDGQKAEQLQKLPKQKGEHIFPPQSHEEISHHQQQDQTQLAPDEMRLPGERLSQGREQEEYQAREQQKEGRAIASLPEYQQRMSPGEDVRDPFQQKKRQDQKDKEKGEKQQQETEGVKERTKKLQGNQLGEYERFGPSRRKAKDMRHYRTLRVRARKTLQKHIGAMHVVNPIDPFPTAPRRETEVLPLEQLPADLTEKVAAEMSKQRKKRIQQKLISRAKSSPAVQGDARGEAHAIDLSEVSNRTGRENESRRGGEVCEEADAAGDFNISLPSSFFFGKGATFEALQRPRAADMSTGEVATAAALLHAGLADKQQQGLELVDVNGKHSQHRTGEAEKEEATKWQEASGDGVAASSSLSHVGSDRAHTTAMEAAGGEKARTEGQAGDASRDSLFSKTEERGREDDAIGGEKALFSPFDDVQQTKEADNIVLVPGQQKEKKIYQQYEKQQEQVDSETTRRIEDTGDAVGMVKQQERECHHPYAGAGELWDGVAALEEGRVKENLYDTGKAEETEDKTCCLRMGFALSSVFSRRQKKQKGNEESLIFSPRGGGGDTCSVCTRRSRFSFLSRDERVPHSVAGSQAGGRQYSAGGEKKRSGSSFYFLTRFFPTAEGSTPPMMAARFQATPCRVNRFLLLAVYVVYALLTGRVYFAWPNISNLLFRSEAYIWLCEEGWERQQQQQGDIVDMRLPQYGGRRYGCEEQNTRVQQLFIVCLSCAYACALLAGLLLDKIGPKLTALFGQCCNCAAWLLLAAANRSMQTYFPAFIVMGIGVDSGYMALLSVANLFPGHEGLVVATLGSAKSLSFAMPTILDAIEGSSSTIKLRDVSIAYAVVGPGLCIVIAFFLINFRPFLPWTSFLHIEEMMEELEQQKLQRTTGWTDILLRSPSLSSIFSAGRKKSARVLSNHAANHIPDNNTIHHKNSHYNNELHLSSSSTAVLTCCPHHTSSSLPQQEDRSFNVGTSCCCTAMKKDLIHNIRQHMVKAKEHSAEKGREKEEIGRDKGEERKNKDVLDGFIKKGEESLTTAVPSSTTATTARGGEFVGEVGEEKEERRKKRREESEEEEDLAVEKAESTVAMAAAAGRAAAATEAAAVATEAAAAAAAEKVATAMNIKDVEAAEEAAAATEIAAAATEVAAAATEEAAHAAVMTVTAATHSRNFTKREEGHTENARKQERETGKYEEEDISAGGKRRRQQDEENTVSTKNKREEEEKERRTILPQGGLKARDLVSRGFLATDPCEMRVSHHKSMALDLFRGNKRNQEEKGGDGNKTHQQEENERRGEGGGGDPTCGNPESVVTPTLRQQLTSKYCLLMMGNYICQAILYPFLSTSAEELFGKSVNDFLGVALPFSSVACLVFGRLTDVYGIMKVLLVLNTTIAVVYLLSLAHNVATSYIAATLLVIYVSFYSSQVYCFVNDTFAAAQFGRIVGMTFMVAGFASLLKIPLHSLVVHVFHSQYTWPVVIMLGLCLFNYILLGFLFYHKKMNPHPFWPHEAAVAAAVKAPAEHINQHHTPH